MARTSNFEMKLIEGSSMEETLDAASLGSVATTVGGKLFLAYGRARVAEQFRLSLTASAEAESLSKKILDAVFKRDVRILQQFADVAEAIRKSGTKGPVNTPFFFTAHFVMFCQSSHPFSGDELTKRYPTFRAAWAKRPFSPSVKETLDYLAERRPSEEAPDYKTVERWLRLLGVKARPRSRK